MTKELVDSGSSVSLVSWSFLYTLGFNGKMESNNGNILKANKTQLTVGGKAELIMQLDKFSPEFRVRFLISSVDISDCLLGLVISQNSNVFCILNGNILSAGRILGHRI